jgi:hypothetical protein
LYSEEVRLETRFQLTGVQNGLQFHGLHNVAFDLHFALHKGLVGLEFAGADVDEVGV